MDISLHKHTQAGTWPVAHQVPVHDGSSRHASFHQSFQGAFSFHEQSRWMKQCPYNLGVSIEIQKSRESIMYQAPTKWTFTSLCENALLKRFAIDIISPGDSTWPTCVTVGWSLLRSAYSSYALKIIKQCTRASKVENLQWYLHLVTLMNEANL